MISAQTRNNSTLGCSVQILLSQNDVAWLLRTKKNENIRIIQPKVVYRSRLSLKGRLTFLRDVLRIVLKFPADPCSVNSSERLPGSWLCYETGPVARLSLRLGVTRRFRSAIALDAQ